MATGQIWTYLIRTAPDSIFPRNESGMHQELKVSHTQQSHLDCVTAAKNMQRANEDLHLWCDGWSNQTGNSLETQTEHWGSYQCFVCFSPLTTSHVDFVLKENNASVELATSLHFTSQQHENPLVEIRNLLKAFNPSQLLSCIFCCV